MQPTRGEDKSSILHPGLNNVSKARVPVLHNGARKEGCCLERNGKYSPPHQPWPWQKAEHSWTPSPLQLSLTFNLAAWWK